MPHLQYSIQGTVRVFRPYPQSSFVNLWFYILSPNYFTRRITDGTATVQVSTKPELLKRALKDITDNYNVNPTVAAPTHLLLYNFYDIKASTSTQV